MCKDLTLCKLSSKFPLMIMYNHVHNWKYTHLYQNYNSSMSMGSLKKTSLLVQRITPYSNTVLIGICH